MMLSIPVAPTLSNQPTKQANASVAAFSAGAQLSFSANCGARVTVARQNVARSARHCSSRAVQVSQHRAVFIASHDIRVCRNAESGCSSASDDRADQWNGRFSIYARASRARVRVCSAIALCGLQEA